MSSPSSPLWRRWPPMSSRASFAAVPIYVSASWDDAPKKTNGRGSVRPRYSIARINESFFRRGPSRSASGPLHGLSLGIFESMGAKIRRTMGPRNSFGWKAIAPFRSYNRQILDQIAIAWPPPFSGNRLEAWCETRKIIFQGSQPRGFQVSWSGVLGLMHQVPRATILGFWLTPLI